MAKSSIKTFKEKIINRDPQSKRTVNLSITHKFGSQFDVGQSGQAFPDCHISRRRIAGPRKISITKKDAEDDPGALPDRIRAIQERQNPSLRQTPDAERHSPIACADPQSP